MFSTSKSLLLKYYLREGMFPWGHVSANNEANAHPVLCSATPSSYQAGTVIIPIFQVRSTRHREGQ